jgi:hypothetical protein
VYFKWCIWLHNLHVEPSSFARRNTSPVGHKLAVTLQKQNPQRAPLPTRVLCNSHGTRAIFVCIVDWCKFWRILHSVEAAVSRYLFIAMSMRIYLSCYAWWVLDEALVPCLSLFIISLLLLLFRVHALREANNFCNYIRAEQSAINYLSLYPRVYKSP